MYALALPVRCLPTPLVGPLSHPSFHYILGSPSAHTAGSPPRSILPTTSHRTFEPSASPGSSDNSPSAPSNDDIEAVIKMAMATSATSRTPNPPRDTRTQLFVGNLPYRVRWQDLKDLFRRAGTVLRADVSLGPDNRSRGYGTVLLATAEDAGRAVDMFNGYCWQTRTLEVRPDRLGDDALPGLAVNGVPGVVGVGVSSLSASAPVSANGTPTLSALPSPLARYPVDEIESRPGTSAGQASRNLFVGNLPFHIQWQDLKDLFRQRGDAERAVRMFNGSPASFAFSPSSAFAGQSLSAASFAQQVLQQQHEQQQAAFGRRQNGEGPYGMSGSGAYEEARENAQGHQQHGGPPSHIPMPYRSPYGFEFLPSSGPSSPYDFYGDISMARHAGIMGFDGQGRYGTAADVVSDDAIAAAVLAAGTMLRATASPLPAGQQPSPTYSSYASHAHSHSQSHSHAHSHSGSSSNQQSHAHSHSSTPQSQSNQHHAHPGPIAIPPPPPASAFPVPAPHTLSPPYPPSRPPHGHPMSPLHHPSLMGMSMGHALLHLPPATIRSPRRTSRAGPRAAAAASRARRDVPYTPFSPGVTMSPGAFWGRPGAAGNPLINPAVGAPVHPHEYRQQHPGPSASPPREYFPPVPVSMAMAQADMGSVRDEPPGYFPFVPPGGVRSSGLAHEIVEDGASASGSGSGSGPSVGVGMSLRLEEKRRNGRAASEASAGTTVGTGTGTGTGTEASPGSRHASSRGTSWHTDEEEVRGLVKGLDAVVVEDVVGAAMNGAKPRAYSAEAGQAQMVQPALHRADSDPVRSGSDGGRAGLGIDLPGLSRA
ncbi:hypothetical protein B0H21DRAFT_761217 [Amylocystis lapponica]|nr:hypothetical protein B0H21DRAFT_761217 [Amylocystis lapponica]